MDAILTKRSRFRRILKVSLQGCEHTVEYNGYGICYESVLVDGNEVSRRGGLFGKMSHTFTFTINDVDAELGVAIPWWCEYIALCQLKLFYLKIDGKLVYCEGNEQNIG